MNETKISESSNVSILTMGREVEVKDDDHCGRCPTGLRKNVDPFEQQPRIRCRANYK